VAVVAWVLDRELREEVARLAAAAGVELEVVAEAGALRVAWTRADVVLLDGAAAAVAAPDRLPRRERVVVVSDGAPQDGAWRGAVGVGAEHVVVLPEGEAFLVGLLGEGGTRAAEHGRVVAVLGGRGGAGASVLAAAVATAAADRGGRALLVDCDPLAGGVDLLLGVEEQPGLRWAGLGLAGGRVSAEALHGALPGRAVRGGRVTVLACGRDEAAPEPAAVAAVVDAGRRAGDTVVCDLPRTLGPAALAALERADLAVLVVPAEVRACAAAQRVAAAVAGRAARLAVVVRGPAPGGLSREDVAAALALDVLTCVRPDRGIAGALERGRLPAGRRSPLAGAARAVLEAVA
jgi:secretion/DNA translocation related CpaE-like protein